MSADENSFLKQSIAICQIAGCQFTKEEMADFKKVEDGEITFDDIIKKFHNQLDALKKEKPECFEVERVEL